MSEWNDDDWTRDFKKDSQPPEENGENLSGESVPPEEPVTPTAPPEALQMETPAEETHTPPQVPPAYRREEVTETPSPAAPQETGPAAWQIRTPEPPRAEENPVWTDPGSVTPPPPVQPEPPVTPEEKKKKPSFGKTLLRAVAIAVVFGIVAGCLFEGTVYFVGDRLGLRTAEQIESAVGIEGPEEEAGITEDPSEEEVQIAESAPAASAPSAAVLAQSNVADIVEGAMPSIVAITNISIVEYQNFWGQRGTYESEGAGSGILIDQDEEYLYIATNNHVVEGTDSNTVQFADGGTAPAEIRGSDANRDIAVLEVKLTDIPEDTRAAIHLAEIGDSTALRVGEPAIAIGNALGYGQSVTVGVISALDRPVSATENGNTITNNCIQTDAAINPGNSGGALLNSEGQVIGINEIKYASTNVEGIGYAIPMATAEPIVQQLIAQETVETGQQGYLGIYGLDVGEEISQSYGIPNGVYVAQVVEGTAAERAGIIKGDVITMIDDYTITTSEELTQTVSSFAPGTEVVVTIWRANRGTYEELKVPVTLGSRLE